MRQPEHQRQPPAPSVRNAVSARTAALDALIESSLEALRAGQGGTHHPEALLFVGNWNDALPRLLIHDSVLEPVDKIIWAVIKTRADPGRGTAFPNYATIGRLANVGSEATVARAMAILRVTRWLTLCGRARDLRGRFRGNVYALHDEPLSLVDTVFLDHAYVAFTYQAIEHRHARVALVASAVARSLELDLAEGKDVLQPQEPIAQRLAAQQDAELAASDTPTAGSEGGTETVPVYGLRSGLRRQLRTHPTGEVQVDHRLQNLKTVDEPSTLHISKAADRLQILKTVTPQNLGAQQILRAQDLPSAVVVGSSNENTTTTTDAGPKPAKIEVAGPELEPAASIGVLRWPQGLTANYRHIAALQLRTVPSDLRQAVLDILDNRLRAIDRGGEALHYGPLAYLKALCAKAIAGQLVLQQQTTQTTPAPAEQGRAGADQASALSVKLRVARGDHAHWQRLLGLDSDPERNAPIRQLVDQALLEVKRIEAEIDAATTRGGNPGLPGN